MSHSPTHDDTSSCDDLTHDDAEKDFGEKEPASSAPVTALARVASAITRTTTNTDNPPIPAAEMLNQPVSEVASVAVYTGPTGWRRCVIVTALYMGLFVSMLDTTVVAIALPSIATHFGNFDRMTWVLTAYLLTHTGFSVIVPKIANVCGRKWVFCASLVWFMGFSVGCGLSRSATQLITFRALKGIGGGGLFSMCSLSGPSMIPPEWKRLFSALASAVIIASGMVGPIIGGAITDTPTSNTWVYIFWLNIPIAGTSLIALLLLWKPRREFDPDYSRKAILGVDFIGEIIFLGASIMAVFGLEEAGSHRYPWSSAVIICCLLFGALCFLLFLTWQATIIAHPRWYIEPLFPVHIIFRRRLVFCAVAATCLSGFTYFIAIVHIPERFLLVDGYTPHRAGIGMLPLVSAAVVGSVISSVASYKRDFTGPTLIVGSAFQLLGYGLMTLLGNSNSVPSWVYGFEVFLGLGLGLGMTSASQILSLEVKPPWLSVSSAVLSQMRTLGGCIGLTNAVIVLQQNIREDSLVKEVLTLPQREAILQSPYLTYSFPPVEKRAATTVFAHAFTEEMEIAMWCSVAAVAISLGVLWRPRFARKKDGPNTAA